MLMAIFFLNTAVPWVQIYTNKYANGYNDGCYDSCGLYVLVALYAYWVPSLLIWGIPFNSMVLYSIIGRPLGFKGHLLKLMIQYTTRYVGLMWHICSQLVSFGFYRAGYDDIFPIVHLISTILLERGYTYVGAEALRYIDHTWTQGPDAIYPFAV